MSRFWCCMFMALLVVPFSGVSATLWMVGGDNGWTPGVNFTDWSKDVKFFKEDRLIFVYHRMENTVLEVNKTAYESCGYPTHNWTGGSGRDIVPLNEPKYYYFISGNEAFCYEGMKLTVHVVDASPNGAPSV